jgi:hypothetical protein
LGRGKKYTRRFLVSTALRVVSSWLFNLWGHPSDMFPKIACSRGRNWGKKDILCLVGWCPNPNPNLNPTPTLSLNLSPNLSRLHQGQLLRQEISRQMVQSKSALVSQVFI